MAESKQDPATWHCDPRPRPGVEGLIESWTQAWNAHDMPAAANVVALDVDFVTVAGLWLQGRPEFLGHHLEIHRRHLRESTWTSLAHEVRFLDDSVGLVHLEWTITGELDARDRVAPPRSGIFTWVVAWIADDWLIAAAHNTNLRPDGSHRLTSGGKA